MTYAEIKTMFTGILNRRDITNSLIETFITLGIQNIQRKLRIPPMELSAAVECDGTKYIAIPSDFLEVIAIYGDDTSNHYKLEQRDLNTVLAASQSSGVPRYYHRVDTNWMVGPVPAEGSTLYVNYYADASALSADDDENWLTLAAPSAVVYAALRYAADHYLDDRKKLFEQTFLEDMVDLQIMAERDALTNASMSPCYPDQN